MAEAVDQSFLHPLPGIGRPLAIPRSTPKKGGNISLFSCRNWGLSIRHPQGVDAGSASETVVAA
ncbi:MAG: hypothetical protein RLZZ274_1385 [Cyanobacteriota bacterium]|jgi:hypothetical protein